jgi:hypothetical protein
MDITRSPMLVVFHGAGIGIDITEIITEIRAE